MSKSTYPKSAELRVERKLVTSEAFLSLKGKAPQVLMLFLYFRTWGQVSKGQHINDNKRNIHFTYRRAEKYGICRQAFSNAITQLVEHGFIDIVRPGLGYGRIETIYALSERWRKYGTEEFRKGVRPKRYTRRFPRKKG